MRAALSRRKLLQAGLAAPAVISAAARAQSPFLLRASLDTSPTHGRTIAVKDYLQKVETASGGRIKTQVFDSGSLFADKDVTKALVQGQAEMAAPGTWLLSSFVPDADLLQLPVFYGQPMALAHKVIDGSVGQAINARILERVRLRVIGPWLDLGFTNWYSTRKPLKSLADLKGMTLRNSGGLGQAWRAKFFGAIPNFTAWPEVPLALSQGTFDGLATTDESVASAHLWDSGVRFELQDHQFPSEYVPVISEAFYGKLPPDLQVLLLKTWTDNIGAYRQQMADAQSRAHDTLQQHGIAITVVPDTELAQVRHRMMAEQDELAKQLHITPALLKQVMQDAGDQA
jgi:C4-dicarboxylate-binding protein DctP